MGIYGLWSDSKYLDRKYRSACYPPGCTYWSNNDHLRDQPECDRLFAATIRASNAIINYYWRS